MGRKAFDEKVALKYQVFVSQFIRNALIFIATVVLNNWVVFRSAFCKMCFGFFISKLPRADSQMYKPCLFLLRLSPGKLLFQNLQPSAFAGEEREHHRIPHAQGDQPGHTRLWGLPDQVWKAPAPQQHPPCQRQVQPDYHVWKAARICDGGECLTGSQAQKMLSHCVMF